MGTQCCTGTICDTDSSINIGPWWITGVPVTCFISNTRCLKDSNYCGLDPGLSALKYTVGDSFYNAPSVEGNTFCTLAKAAAQFHPCPSTDGSRLIDKSYQAGFDCAQLDKISSAPYTGHGSAESSGRITTDQHKGSLIQESSGAGFFVHGK